jgi:hypothetical protein
MVKRLCTYGASLLFCIILPLLPLILDALLKEKLLYSELIITAALYPMSLFVQSRNDLLFAVGVLLCIIFSIGLSYHMPGKLTINWSAIRVEDVGSYKLLKFSGIAILSVSVIHMIERFTTHLIKGEKFFFI